MLVINRLSSTVNLKIQAARRRMTRSERRRKKIKRRRYERKIQKTLGL